MCWTSHLVPLFTTSFLLSFSVLVVYGLIKFSFLTLMPPLVQKSYILISVLFGCAKFSTLTLYKKCLKIVQPCSPKMQEAYMSIMAIPLPFIKLLFSNWVYFVFRTPELFLIISIAIVPWDIATFTDYFNKYCYWIPVLSFELNFL